jgi:SagB-type dehydrogenase family enzyme
VTLPAIPSAMVVDLVYGEGVPLDDPAEAYHEASRLSPSTALAQLPGLQRLQDEPVLRASVERAARLHPPRRGVQLFSPKPLPMSLDRAIDHRRSHLTGSLGRPDRHELSTLLDTAYGVRRRDDGLRRTVPSGGALYPLELYPVVLTVEDVEPGVYHYDPFAHRLADLARDVALLERALVDPDLLARTSVAVVITAVFWRSRFKYGQRAYRFALLEVGHVAQNLLLAAAALELEALPLGGFYDRRLEDAIGIDGVDESALYLLLIGGKR